jgi:hypothetical protein
MYSCNAWLDTRKLKLSGPRQTRDEASIHDHWAPSPLRANDKRKGDVMAKHRAARVDEVNLRRLGGGLLMGALTSATLAVTAVGTAGEANATCVSAGGFHIGSGCTTSSPGDFALAIGKGATATATGGRNVAIAWGTGASAMASGGTGNTAIAIGNTPSGSTGAQNLAGMQVRGTTAIAGTDDTASKDALAVRQPSNNNTAIAIGVGTRANAGYGNGNTARAIGTNVRATAGQGNRNVAEVFGSDGSTADAGNGDGNLAIVHGDNSHGTAGVGSRSTTPSATLRADISDTSSNGGNYNVAIVHGNESTATASGGNFNRATVFGDRSIANAGRGLVRYLSKEDVSSTSNRNNASVVGNDSVANAGPGDDSRASVSGNNSSASARLGQRVRVHGNNVNPPKGAAE